MTQVFNRRTRRGLLHFEKLRQHVADRVAALEEGYPWLLHERRDRLIEELTALLHFAEMYQLNVPEWFLYRVRNQLALVYNPRDLDPVIRFVREYDEMQYPEEFKL